MSELWYKATAYGVQAIEIEKSTEQSVFLGTNKRREAIDSSYHHWRKNKKFAVDAVIIDMERDVLNAKGSLKYLEERLSNYLKENT